MRALKSAPLAAAALLALASCHSDVTCVYDSDCASEGTGYVCVPDSSGWGHCLTAADVFGVEQDGGTTTTTTTAACGDAGLPPPVDAGVDAGTPVVDAGIDAGTPGVDAGTPVDAGIDAGTPSGDAGLDAGEATDAGTDAGAGTEPDGGDAG